MLEKKLNLLFDEWASQNHHKNKGFIRDGIIDFDKWQNSNKKILFVLKEAYSDPEDPKDFDLCYKIREEWRGPKGGIWWNLACWAYGIQYSNQYVTAEFPDHTMIEQRKLAREALLGSSILNIKKSNGQTKSNDEDLKYYSLKDLIYIQREIDLINPDIIVCGNVWDYIKIIWPKVESVYDLVCKNDGTYFVDFWHPANQFPTKLNYYCLNSVIVNSGFYK